MVDRSTLSERRLAATIAILLDRPTDVDDYSLTEMNQEDQQYLTPELKDLVQSVPKRSHEVNAWLYDTGTDKLGIPPGWELVTLERRHYPTFVGGSMNYYECCLQRIEPAAGITSGQKHHIVRQDTNRDAALTLAIEEAIRFDTPKKGK